MPEFWKDKSFWFAVGTVLVGVLEYFGFGDYTPSSEVVAIAVVVIGLVNWFLHRNETARAMANTKR